MKKITRSTVARLLPVRANTAHKGDLGRVLVVAGSRTMCGAGFLCAKSALTSGAGLVYWALPQSMQPAFAAALPEVITLPLPETKTGEISASAWAVLQAFIKKTKPSLVAVGPGMGSSPLLKILLTEIDLPLVLDADALNILAEQPTVSFKNPVILTPHPGEMTRLLKASVAISLQERISQVTQLAQKTKAVCVLKGHDTLLAQYLPNKQVQIWQNTTGGPALAKGGSGDVLTGLIAGLWAQAGMKNGFNVISAFQMAACAVYVHGLAGDWAAKALGPYSVLATDIISVIPAAFQQIVGKEK